MLAANRQGLTLQERDRRWARVRELMTEQGIDLLITMPEFKSEDSFYLANQTGVVLFPLEGEPHLILGGEGSNRALHSEGWIADKSSATATGSTIVPYGKATAERLRALNVGRKRVGLVGMAGTKYIHIRQPEGYLSYSSVRLIEEALPDATIVDGTPVLSEARNIKSEEEIELIRQAVRIAEAGLDNLIENARVGEKQSRVFGQLILEQWEQGAQETHTSWCAGGWGEHKWRYTTPPPGFIGEDFYISVEIGPSVQGYGCQIANTVVVGKPTPQARDIFELGHAAFERARELMRPGLTWGEVEDGVRQLETDRYGIYLLVHGVAYGNEGPMIIPVDRSPIREEPVREGTTFVLKPGAFPKNEPSYAPTTRSHTCSGGETVVVRRDGAERLGTRPYELPIV
jgi:Xaa-Pro aminopeptidase